MAKIKTALAATPLDYYDFHFYGNSERALSIVRQAQAAVAPAPLVIGETGVSTLQYTEGEQAAYLARVFQAASAAGLKSVAPWTLNDFTAGAIPESAVAQVPAQYAFGLYRTNGTAKPAAAVVKAAWTGTAYPATLLDLGFENATGQTPWSAYLPNLGVATKTQAVAHSGKWSVSLTNTGKSAAGSPSYRVAPVTPVQAGQKWHAEAWARGNAATGTTQIALSWFDANDKWLGGASSASLPAGTTGWTKLAVDATAPAGAASLQVHLKSGRQHRHSLVRRRRDHRLVTPAPGPIDEAARTRPMRSTSSESSSRQRSARTLFYRSKRRHDQRRDDGDGGEDSRARARPER